MEFVVVAVHSLSPVQLFAPPSTAACQASLSITSSWNLLTFVSIESVMSSNHLILSHPLLLLPSIFPSIRVFSNESALRIRWPKYQYLTVKITTEGKVVKLSKIIHFRFSYDLVIKSLKLLICLIVILCVHYDNKEL